MSDNLEDVIYDQFAEALDNKEGAEYSQDEFRSLGNDEYSHQDAAGFVGRNDYIEGQVCFDPGSEKAVYMLVEDKGDSVVIDVKKMGDAAGVATYLEGQTPGEYDSDLNSVNSGGFKSAAARAEDHHMIPEKEGEEPDIIQESQVSVNDEMWDSNAGRKLVDRALEP